METGQLILIIISILFILIIITDVIFHIINKEQGVYRDNLFKVTYVKSLNRYTCELHKKAKKAIFQETSKNINIQIYGYSIDDVLKKAKEELKEQLKWDIK